MERLEERRKELIEEAARRYNEDKKMLREHIGPGGVRLSKEEQQEIYQEALNDPEKMLGILQNLQNRHKMPPDQVPRSFVEWLDEMGATAQAIPQHQRQMTNSSQLGSLGE